MGHCLWQIKIMQETRQIARKEVTVMTIQGVTMRKSGAEDIRIHCSRKLQLTETHVYISTKNYSNCYRKRELTETQV